VSNKFYLMIKIANSQLKKDRKTLIIALSALSELRLKVSDEIKLAGFLETRLVTSRRSQCFLITWSYLIIYRRIATVTERGCSYEPELWGPFKREPIVCEADPKIWMGAQICHCRGAPVDPRMMNHNFTGGQPNCNQHPVRLVYGGMKNPSNHKSSFASSIRTIWFWSKHSKKVFQFIGGISSILDRSGCHQ
jgi:hypothetical protein